MKPRKLPPLQIPPKETVTPKELIPPKKLRPLDRAVTPPPSPSSPKPPLDFVFVPDPESMSQISSIKDPDRNRRMNDTERAIQDKRDKLERSMDDARTRQEGFRLQRMGDPSLVKTTDFGSLAGLNPYDPFKYKI